MILLAVGAALAEGTALWLSTEPDPTLDPTADHIVADTLLPPPAWTDEDARAIQQLSDELEAVRPLLDVFDGELQIMLRLEQALSNIAVIRDEDRALIVNALLFQGLAVDRYFQDGLAEESGAAPYRVAYGSDVEVRPWIDAIAMAADLVPGADQIPEEPQMLSFQETRARHLLRGSSTLVVMLPEDARLTVDGQEQVGGQIQALPGNHWMALTVDGVILTHTRVRTEPGGSASFARPLLASDLAALTASMAAEESSILLNDVTLQAISDLEAPILLHTGEGRQRQTYTVSGNRAQPWIEPETGPESGLGWRIAAGTGWLYDGDFYLQNAAEGAPESVATVNAFSPLISVGAEWRFGTPVVGVGVDTLLPAGEWHDLPTGDTRMRIRPYPHLAAGIRSLQVTAGMMLPWHVGVGPRAHLVLSEQVGLTLSGAYVYGVPLPLSREDGSTFTAHPAQTAWLSLGISR